MGLKYETVAKLCDRLDDEGTKPTKLLLASLLPGKPSHTTILKHLNRWKEEKRKRSEELELSPEVIHALRSEISCHSERTRASESERVENALEQAKEAMASLGKMEKELNALYKALAAEKEANEVHRRKEAANHEKITALEARLGEADERFSEQAHKTEILEGVRRRLESELAAVKAERDHEISTRKALQEHDFRAMEQFSLMHSEKTNHQHKNSRAKSEKPRAKPTAATRSSRKRRRTLGR